eukprot:IDg11721t1
MLSLPSSISHLQQDASHFLGSDEFLKVVALLGKALKCGQSEVAKVKMSQSSVRDCNLTYEDISPLCRSPRKARTDVTDCLTRVELSKRSRTKTTKGFELQLIEVAGLTSRLHKLALFTKPAACLH